MTKAQYIELSKIKSGGGWKTTGVALSRKGWVANTSDRKLNGGLYVTFAGLKAMREYKKQELNPC